MARTSSVYLQVPFTGFDLHGCNGKKRIILESFNKALQLYFLGTSGGCKWEENWEKIYPNLATPEDSEENKKKAKEWIFENDELIHCNKIRMECSACYGCKDNPAGHVRKRLDREAFELHRQNISKIERLHDMVRMSLTELREIGDLEFEMLRLFWWQIEKVMSQSRMRIL